MITSLVLSAIHHHLLFAKTNLMSAAAMATARGQLARSVTPRVRALKALDGHKRMCAERSLSHVAIALVLMQSVKGVEVAS